MTVKNIATKLVLFVLLLPLAFAEATSIEIRGDLFYHVSQKFRRVYGSCAPDLQLELSAPTNSSNVNVWGNFSYSPKSGSCGCGNSYTKIQIFNTSVGLKYTIPQIVEGADVYFGLGGSISAVNIRNKSFCINERVTNCAPGVILKSGFIKYLTSNYYLNVFCDYLYQPVCYSGTVDVGGPKLGLGLGYDF